MGSDDPEVWLAWAHLLSGRRLSPADELVPIPALELRELWRRLVNQFPAGLRQPDLLAWHLRQATASEHDAQWFAARFHYERAAKLRPDQPQFREALNRANAALVQAQARNVSADPARDSLQRPPNADARLLDLSKYYNASLNETWLPTNVVASGNDLSEMPRGMQNFGGTRFDVRGVVQLSGAALENLGSRFPREVRGIPVKQRCRRLHFLHGASWSALSGVHVATYRVHYVDGDTADVRVIYGRHLREWWSPATSAALTLGAGIGWEGSNPATRALGMKVRLYHMAWLNPRPDQEIQSLDLLSTMETPAPFVLAISTE